MQEELGRLQETIKTLTKQITHKRLYVQAKESQTASQIANQITKVEGSGYNNGVTPAKRVRSERRCGRCSQIRHNSRTCQVELEDEDDSEESIE